MPKVVGQRSRMRRLAPRALGMVATGAGTVLMIFTLQARPHQFEARGAAAIAGLELQNASLPDDPTLLADLERAVDLRRREHFDRVLDAREPGELIEHATLTDAHFDHRTYGIDTLFIVGDELFGYLFRPENGWGSGGADRTAIDYTPQFRRDHIGAAARPDAFG